MQSTGMLVAGSGSGTNTLVAVAARAVVGVLVAVSMVAWRPSRLGGGCRA